MSDQNSITTPELQKAVSDVEKIFEQYKKGKSIPNIASELDFPQSYVHDILLCAQSLAEEDPVAIAMLMINE